MRRRGRGNFKKQIKRAFSKQNMKKVGKTTLKGLKKGIDVGLELAPIPLAALGATAAFSNPALMPAFMKASAATGLVHAVRPLLGKGRSGGFMNI